MTLKSTRVWLATAVAAVALGAANFAQGAALQIDGTDGDPGLGVWDSSEATQTGNVGGVGVEATISEPKWQTFFNNDIGLYTNATLFGSLAQPAGTIGDFLRIALSSGDMFTVSIEILGELTDPIFYLADIDLAGGAISFDSDWTERVGTNGSFVGDRFVSDGGDEPGGFAAIKFGGTFGAGAVFDFGIDFSDTSPGGEFIAIGLASPMKVMDDPIPDPDVIPLPGAGILLIGALGALGVVRRRSTRAS